MITRDELNSGNGIGVDGLIVDLLNSLSTVRELSELQFSGRDEVSLIKKALESLIHNQDMERCSFFRLGDDNVLTNVTGISFSEALEDRVFSDTPVQFRVGEGIIGLAAEKKTLQHCHNCLEDERFFSHDQMSALLPGSVISIPVFAANLELIGVLNISHPEPYHFSQWHIRLLEIYKNIFGQLISNFRLFNRMEQEISARTSKLEKAYEDLKVLKEHYENISVQDQLTGLYNRRYFYNQVEYTLASYDRYGHAMCLLIMDIDHFKRINDTYGHAFGDQVLIDVARVLQTQVRHVDILVRFGGEEFVIIFTNTECDKGLVFAERVRKEVEELKWQENAQPVAVTLSIGMYCIDPECCEKNQKTNIDQVIHYADVAMYEAKRRGRNQVVRFTPALLEHIPEQD